MKTAGILLVIAGIITVFNGGFSDTTHKNVPDMGLILVNDAEQHPVRISPILGISAIAVGGALVFFRIKQGR